MKIGLALSGGALRGAAHVGVLKALEEAQIPIDMVSGTSAGSLVGGPYAAGRTVEELEAETQMLDDKLLDFNSAGAAKAIVGSVFGRRAAFSGLFKGNEVYKLAFKMTRGIGVMQALMPVALCAVDIVSGSTIMFTNSGIPSIPGDYITSGDIVMAAAITASCSIPAVFVPRQWNGMSLVDGGVTEYVPVKVLRDMGADYVIAVDLGRDSGHPQKAEAIFEIATRSFDIMSRRLADESLRYADAVIAPFVADIGLFDFKRAGEAVERGYKAAKRVIPTIKTQLNRAVSQRKAT